MLGAFRGFILRVLGYAWYFSERDTASTAQILQAVLYFGVCECWP